MAKSSVIRKAKPMSPTLVRGASRGAVDQIRKLQLRVAEVMNLCSMAAAAASSERRAVNDEETQGSMNIAVRELDAIAEGLDAAATALEAVHG